MLWISCIIYWIFVFNTSSCLPTMSVIGPSTVIQYPSQLMSDNTATIIFPKQSVSDSTLVQVTVGDQNLCSANETCTFVDSCTFAVELLNNGKSNQVRNKTCGWEGNKSKVCCPSTDNSYSTTTTVDELTQDDVANLSSNVNIPHYAFADRRICGTVAFENRIIGGKIARPEEFPWLVRIYHRTRDGHEFYCAGSLISDIHVLTAAHCLNPNLSPVAVRLGEWNANQEDDCYEYDEDTLKCIDKPVDRRISSTVIHPNFTSQNFSNDIGIIKLDEPVNFTDYIRPVCLPTTNYVKRQGYSIDNVRYETAGWGKTEFGMLSAIKVKVFLNAVSHELCSKSMQNLSPDSEDEVICAGGQAGKDTCQGDSGGPLVRGISEDHKYNTFLFGITSFGSSKCGMAGKPGIYTRVSNYMDWIIKNLT